LCKCWYPPLIISPQECAIGANNDHSLEVADPYDGDVVLTTNSGIVSLLATNSYGFSYLFTATNDTLVHKVIKR